VVLLRRTGGVPRFAHFYELKMGFKAGLVVVGLWTPESDVTTLATDSSRRSQSPKFSKVQTGSEQQNQPKSGSIYIRFAYFDQAH
jgi:hypothetical protein